MNRDGYRPDTAAPPGRVLRRSMGHLGSDVLTLMELQAELLQVDLRDWAKSFVKPIVAMVLALLVLVASLPVLLLSLGYFLEDATNLSLGASMLIAAGAGLATAAICVGLGVWWLKQDKPMLSRFITELRKNVRWLKHVLTSPPKVIRFD